MFGRERLPGRKGNTKMLKKRMMVIVAVTGFALAMLAGCQNNAQTGALIGSVAGAGIGQLAGRSTEATLIGAAIGGGGGYLIGNESDKKKEQARTDARFAAVQQDINSQLVNVTNSNGSIIQVKLTRSGTGWVGPRGEFYPTLPTQEQLRPVYGF